MLFHIVLRVTPGKGLAAGNQVRRDAARRDLHITLDLKMSVKHPESAMWLEAKGQVKTAEVRLA